jgi:hypothetical protein
VCVCVCREGLPLSQTTGRMESLVFPGFPHSPLSLPSLLLVGPTTGSATGQSGWVPSCSSFLQRQGRCLKSQFPAGLLIDCFWFGFCRPVQENIRIVVSVTSRKRCGVGDLLTLNLEARGVTWIAQWSLVAFVLVLLVGQSSV